jgi:hypothetical protein
LTQRDLHSEKVPLSLLRILYDPYSDILVTKCFILPSRCPELVKLGGIGRLSWQLHTIIDNITVILACEGSGVFCTVTSIQLLKLIWLVACKMLNFFKGGDLYNHTL